MMLKRAGDFLDKFKKITQTNFFIKELLLGVVKSELDIVLDKKNITFNKKTGVIFIQTNNTQKTSLFLNKNNIIKKINTLAQKKIVKDIR